MKHNLSFKNCYVLGQCYSCKQFDHNILDCPYIHYYPQKTQVIGRHIFSKDQGREEKERRKKRVNFRKMSEKVRLGAKKLKLDLLYDQNKLEGEYEDYLQIDSDIVFQKRTGLLKYQKKNNNTDQSQDSKSSSENNNSENENGESDMDSNGSDEDVNNDSATEEGNNNNQDKVSYGITINENLLQDPTTSNGPRFNLKENNLFIIGIKLLLKQLIHSEFNNNNNNNNNNSSNSPSNNNAQSQQQHQRSNRRLLSKKYTMNPNNKQKPQNSRNSIEVPQLSFKRFSVLTNNLPGEAEKQVVNTVTTATHTNETGILKQNTLIGNYGGGRERDSVKNDLNIKNDSNNPNILQLNNYKESLQVNFKANTPSNLNNSWQLPLTPLSQQQQQGGNSSFGAVVKPLLMIPLQDNQVVQQQQQQQQIQQQQLLQQLQEQDEQVEVEDDGFFVIAQFDVKKEFKYFQPHNNYSNVVIFKKKFNRRQSRREIQILNVVKRKRILFPNNNSSQN